MLLEGIRKKMHQVTSTRRNRERWIRPVISCAAGAALSLCWTQNISPATGVAVTFLLGLIIASATSDSPRESAGAWFLAGVALRAGAFFWVPAVVEDSFGVSQPVALLFFLLMITFESLTWAITGYLCARAAFQKTFSIWVVPAAILALDAFWPRVFPWALGHMFVGIPEISQIAEIAGVHGLTWLIVTASFGVAALIQFVLRRFFGRTVPVSHCGFCSGQCLVMAFSGLVLMATAAVWGAARINYFQNIFRETTPVRVAAAQVDTTAVNAEIRLRELSESVTPAPDLVVWPESSIGFYSEQIQDFCDEESVRQFAREPYCGLPGYSVPGSALLACGATFSEDASPEGPYLNTAFLINHEQKILGKSGKRTLLPWGEYVPGQDLVPSLRAIAGIDSLRSFERSAEPIQTEKGLRIGAMICYDDINAETAAQSAAAGALILTTQVNAADYENPIALRQHLLLAQLRTIENRRYLVRSASTGITCIVSPLGEIIAECPPKQEGIVSANIHAMSVTTIFTRFGNWLVYLNLLAFAPIVRRFGQDIAAKMLSSRK
jgi:apolipoprotein N-acyltransferase